MTFGLPAFARWLGGRRHAAAGVPLGRWVVVDTETSGLDPGSDRLLAIGGVAVADDGIRPDDSFEVVLAGAAVGDAANIAVHGIGHGAQATGIPPTEALGAFRAWAAGAPRVGFHADFDRVALARAFAAAELEDDDAAWLDLAPLALALAPELARTGSRSLDDALAAFGIVCAARHNAAADALATAELLLRLRAVAAAQGVRGFEALVKVGRQKKWLGSTH
jgi:DNA polymerase III subunit epsilon